MPCLREVLDPRTVPRLSYTSPARGIRARAAPVAETCRATANPTTSVNDLDIAPPVVYLPQPTTPGRLPSFSFRGVSHPSCAKTMPTARPTVTRVCGPTPER